MAEPRRGRPRRSAAQVDEMREKIIGTARELFATEGFQSVSMRRVAAQASCSPMTLYGYFRNKSELLRHIWEQFFDPLFAQVNAAARQDAPPGEKLRAMAQTYLAYWLEHPDRYRLVYLNDDQIEDGDTYYAARPGTLARHAVFAETIIAGQQTGDIEPGDPAAMAEALICMMIGIAHNLITVSEHPWSSGDKLLDIMLDGVLARPSSPR